MNTTMNLIRKTLHNRWALGALVVIATVGIAYLVWGVMGWVALGSGAIGLSLPFLLGDSKPYTDEDHEEQARRWKWDGSNNADGLSD